MRRAGLGKGWVLIGVAVLLGIGCGPRAVTLRATESPAQVSVAERWVDAHAGASAETNGGSETFRSLAEALKDGRAGIIHVRAGLYEGPFVIPPGVTLRGHGAVVLHAPSEAPEVVLLSTGSSLEDVHVQGARDGIRVMAGLEREARLLRVKLSGQREAGIAVQRGQLVAADLEVEGTISGGAGVRVLSGARAELIRTTFRGGLDSGLRLEPGATARVVDGRSDGPAHGIRSNGAELEVEGFHAHGGRAAGIGLGGGKARLRDVRFTGHEYGLLAGGGAEVSVDGLVSIRADRAGVGIAASEAVLRDVLVLEAGAHGAINAVGSTLDLQRFLVSGARGYGLNLHGGKAQVSHGIVRGISDDGGGGGDAVHVRVGEARLSHLDLSELGGVGVLAAQGATVDVREVSVRRARWAGLLAETTAKLTAHSVSVTDSQGVALAIPGDADVTIDTLYSAKNAQGPLWIECTSGASLRVGRLLVAKGEASPNLSQPCIGRLTP